MWKDRAWRAPISIGSLDELYDLAQGTRQYAEACGHELFYSEHAGIDHTIIDEDLPVALDWFLARPHPCIASETPIGSAGSPGTAGSGSVPADSGIAPGAGGASVGAGPAESPSDITGMYADHMNGTTSSNPGGCGCRMGSRSDGRTGAAILVGLATVLVRRRRSVR